MIKKRFLAISFVMVFLLIGNVSWSENQVPENATVSESGDQTVKRVEDSGKGQVRSPEEIAKVTARFDAKIPDDHPLKAVIEKIDDLFHRGSAINYTEEGVKMLKESLDICASEVEKHPDEYELLWRYARGAYKYPESMKGILMPGWKEASGEWGRKGMKIAEKAQKIQPQRVEAYFWITACIGRYVDDAGIITAIKEGFLPKSKKSMAKAYEIDKTYYDYDPVFGSAMINHTPPWPLKDEKKAVVYWAEFIKSYTNTWEPYMPLIHGADLYLSMKGDENKKKAKEFLEKLINSPTPRPFYINQAKEMMKEIKD